MSIVKIAIEKVNEDVFRLVFIEADENEVMSVANIVEAPKSIVHTFAGCYDNVLDLSAIWCSWDFNLDTRVKKITTAIKKIVEQAQ